MNEKIARLRSPRWERSYGLRLLLTDCTVLVFAVFAGQLLWFGFEVPTVATNAGDTRVITIGYTAVSLAVVAFWMLGLVYFDTRDPKVIGSGTDEYRRIVNATVRLFGLAAIALFVVKWDLGRGYFLTALPLGLFLLLLSRWLWRQWLRVRREEGLYLHHALLVGERRKSRHVLEQLSRDPSSGLVALGALTGGGSTQKPLVNGVPVLGSYGDLISIIEETKADTVIVTGADDLGPEHLRQLGWDLEDRGVSLIVAPALSGIAGPRIHTRPVAGLSLIHVELPNFEGTMRVTKRLFDIVGSTVVMVIALPVFLVVAVAVKLSSSGPIFYRQERIGRRGEPFGMLKFRSMEQGADDQLKSLLDEQGTSDKPLFKINNDPRITNVGKVIRRYSLDEFPQLINVLFGQMSLVGPRPQRAAEVALYDDAARRRLFMKPGMSGLWQISGRSSLSWEDAIRLDLYYVENWSLTTDFIILVRTVRAVLRAQGAM